MRKYICMTFTDNTEMFRWEHRDAEGNVQDRGTISLSDNNLGYLLCSIMELDTGAVVEIADKYELDGVPRKWMHARNSQEIYFELVGLSEIFRMYAPQEYNHIRSDHDALRPSFPHFREQVRKYLAYCEQEQLSYHGGFFYFLLGSNYFGEKMDLRYQDDIPMVDPVFWESTEKLGTLDDLDSLHRIFAGEKNANRHIDSRTYTVAENENRLAIAALASLRELGIRNKVLRQCANCGHWFVPENRSDTLYCDRISPQEPTMDCKTYASQRLWYQKQKQDELAVLSRNILSAKGMLAKRNPDIPAYQQSYDYFRAERMKWKKAVEAGEAPRDAYREWLLKMQEQKIIKEAFDGID